MTVAAFIGSQRAEYRVPVTVSCRALGVSASWYYKWRDRPPTPRQDRAEQLVEAVWESFQASGFTYGSPRVWLDLREAGWRVSVNTVAAVMAAHGWAGRKPPRRRSLTRQGRRPAAPDLVGRRFIANRPDQLWCGDVTYIDTGEGWLYLATVLDLCSRRLLGYAMADTHDAGLTQAALGMAVTARAGEGRTTRGVVFHSDRGSRIHRCHLRHRLPAAGRDPVHGQGRLRAGQRRRRGGQLHDQGRTRPPPPLRQPRRRPHRDRHMDLELLQHPPPALRLRRTVPSGLRKADQHRSHCRPGRPGRIETVSTITGD